MLLIDGVKYKLWKPEDEEKEFEPMIKEHAKEIFGKDSLYFDIRQKLVSKTGIGSIPDGYAISFSKPYQWYIVEGELSSHPLYDHIVKQINMFMSGVKNPETQKEILNVLYNETVSDPVTEAYVKKMIDFKEIHHFLSELISNTPEVVIIIEQKDVKIQEACENLKVQPHVIEFKTYTREDVGISVHAHLFEPLSVPSKIPEHKKKTEGKKLPDHYESWNKMFAWVDDNTKDLVKELTSNVLGLGEIVHGALGRHYCFCKGKPGTRHRFACLILAKSALKVRIRTDPKTFKDPGKWTAEKIYKGWFFGHGVGEEREFKLTEKGQIAYAMELIKHSYEISG